MPSVGLKPRSARSPGFCSASRSRRRRRGNLRFMKRGRRGEQEWSGRAGVASLFPGPRRAVALARQRLASGRSPAEERATLGSLAAPGPPCASASSSAAAARPFVSIPQLAASPLPRAPSNRFLGAPQSVFHREGGALKPTLSSRLRDRRPIAAPASQRKGSPFPPSPDRSPQQTGGEGSSGGGGRSYEQAQRVASSEAGQAWSLLLLRKKRRGQVREWSHMLQEIMKRSQPAGRFNSVLLFICVSILKSYPRLWPQAATLSSALRMHAPDLRVGFPLSLSLSKFCLNCDSNKTLALEDFGRAISPVRYQMKAKHKVWWGVKCKPRRPFFE